MRSFSALPNPVEIEARPRARARLVFTVSLLLLGLWVVRHYAVALTWAAVIAISLWPLYRPLKKRFPERGRATLPLVATLVTGAVLAAPLALALAEIGRETQALLAWFRDTQQSGLPPPAWLKDVPALGAALEQWWRASLADPGADGNVLSTVDKETIGAWSQALVGQVLHRVLLALLTLMCLFFLLRDGEDVSRRVFALSDRWLGGPGERLAEKMVEAVRGTVVGTVMVAVTEGALITVAYVAAGVPQPLLFGILTTAFAMLPLGAWVAFTAAALVLLAQDGAAFAAALVFGWGAAVMLIGDNLVQPALIGGAVRMPFIWMLVGILGGLETFGLVGLFVGPVIMVALLTIWREWTTDERDGCKAASA